MEKKYAKKTWSFGSSEEWENKFPKCAIKFSKNSTSKY